MKSIALVPAGRAVASNSHHGMMPSLMRTIQRSPLFRSMKANSALSGPISRSAAPIDRQIAERRVIAREQQMIAIVDGDAELRVLVGAAAPARLPGLLVHDHALAAFGEANRGGKAGKPGTDDMDRARHQMNA